MSKIINDYQFIDGTRLSSVIEALIFASDEPISGEKIVEIIVNNEDQIEINTETVELFVEKLNDRYEEQMQSFHIEKIAGGYTFLTNKKFHYWLSIFQHENAYKKLSQAAIESLAIIAYKQPITKPEVDQIRGVDSGYIIRQLLEKALVEVSGRADRPGKPLLYRTTDHFLRHFGINSVNELPKPREIEEILKDDDMAEHRQLLLEHALIQEEMAAEEEGENRADNLLNNFDSGNNSNQNGQNNDVDKVEDTDETGNIDNNDE